MYLKIIILNLSIHLLYTIVKKKMQYNILKMNKDFKLVISTDGFINSFETYYKLKSELDRTFQILEKDIFSNRYLRNIYKNT